MAKILGIGGVFFRTKEPSATQQWYASHLKLPAGDDGYVVFQSRQQNADIEEAMVWSPFRSDTEYFGDSGQEFMINYIVDDLEGMRAQLRATGVAVLDKVEDLDGFGKFGWAEDCDGRRIELWEPSR